MKYVLICFVVVFMSSCNNDTQLQMMRDSHLIGCLDTSHHYLDSPKLSEKEWHEAVEFCQQKANYYLYTLTKAGS